ncbi:MAG: hypothetical protein JWP89_590 [Schlesneria sp.]|nr:hypothetical protein [Schlesneria sp.]
MLLSNVILPEAFSADNFSDPVYHLNTEIFLLGVHSNGILLFDAENRLRNELIEQVDKLAGIPKGIKSHALFTDLLQPGKKNAGGLMRTTCSFNAARHVDDVAVNTAIKCKADVLLVDPASHSRLAASDLGNTQLISVPDYIESSSEIRRRRYSESLPTTDKMSPLEFDRLVVGATRFSRWLRFYDKQIGHGRSLSRFERGMERILRVWIDNAFFDKAELSAELYTVVHESILGENLSDQSAAYNRVKCDLVERLHDKLGIPIKMHFKREPENKEESICHARYLETQSIAIHFEKGFDFIKIDKSCSRTTIRPERISVTHLNEYRKLPEYVPEIIELTPLESDSGRKKGRLR